MSTDDILRAWFKPTRPFIRLALLFAPGVQPLVEDMIDGRTSVPRGLWILFWFVVPCIDALYQRSPRARPNPFSMIVPAPTRTLPPEILPPSTPPSSDLPRQPEEE